MAAVLAAAVRVEDQSRRWMRLNHAMRSASVTRLACMCGCMLQPTTWRLNRSITAARYSQPSSVAM